jgi:hypothetical protein
LCSGLCSGTVLQAEPLAMHSKTLPLLCQVLRWGVAAGFLSLGLCRGVGPELPGTLTLQNPLRLPLLTGGLSQATTRLAKVAFQFVVGPR